MRSRRQARIHPRRPQRAAGRHERDHRRHPHSRVDSRHPRSARSRRRGHGDLAPRSTERRKIQCRRFARADRKAPLGAPRPGGAPDPRLGRRRSVAREPQARSGRAARELPLQHRGEEERRNARTENGASVRRLCQRRFRDRAPRRGNNTRHRAVRARRVRRPSAGRRARRAGSRARAAQTPVGGNRRWRQGVHQAHRTQGAGRQGRRARRWRGDRQHLHCRGGRTGRQVAFGTRSGR